MVRFLGRAILGPKQAHFIYMPATDAGYKDWGNQMKKVLLVLAVLIVVLFGMIATPAKADGILPDNRTVLTIVVYAQRPLRFRMSPINESFLPAAWHKDNLFGNTDRRATLALADQDGFMVIQGKTVAIGFGGCPIGPCDHSATWYEIQGSIRYTKGDFHRKPDLVIERGVHYILLDMRGPDYVRTLCEAPPVIFRVCTWLTNHPNTVK